MSYRIGILEKSAYPDDEVFLALIPGYFNDETRASEKAAAVSRLDEILGKIVVVVRVVAGYKADGVREVDTKELGCA